MDTTAATSIKRVRIALENPPAARNRPVFDAPMCRFSVSRCVAKILKGPSHTEDSLLSNDFLIARWKLRLLGIRLAQKPTCFWLANRVLHAPSFLVLDIGSNS
jgi:hypothetical protein